MKYIVVVLFLGLISCNTETPTQFSNEALSDTLITLDKTELSFKEVLSKYKNKTVLIDFWASWCGDCIKGLPKIAELQKEYTEIEYVFISIDDSYKNWTYGIDRYRIKGNHYLLPSGWKGALGSFIDLDWIPRYMVVAPNGSIKLFEAVTVNDERILEAIKN